MQTQQIITNYLLKAVLPCYFQQVFRLYSYGISLLFFLILALFSTQSKAQYWQTKHYSVENGLPDNYIYGFEKYNDSLYIATDAGIVTFDGKIFNPWHNERLNSTVVIFSPGKSNLIVSSWQDGLLLCKNKELKKINSLRINKVASNGKTHLFYNSYRKDYFLRVTPDENIDTIITYPLEDKSRFVGMNHKHIYVSQSNQFHIYNLQGKKLAVQNQPLLKEATTFSAIHNHLFFGNTLGEISWAPVQSPEQSFTYALEANKSITSIKRYKKNQLLVQASDNSEHNDLYLITLNPEVTRVLKVEKLFTEKNGISDIFIDNGLIYVATYGNGFFKIQPSFIKLYNKEDTGLPVPKFVFENPQGQLVFSTENTFYTLKNDGSFSAKETPIRISKVLEENKQLFYSSFTKLYDHQFKEVAPLRVTDIIKMDEEEILYCSKYYIWHIPKSMPPEQPFYTDQLKGYKKINSSIFANSTIFLGTENGVVVLTKSTTGKWKQTNHLLSQKFKGKRIIQILKYKTGFLIVTPYAIFTFINNNIKQITFTEQPVQINTVYIDHDGDFFIGTNKGFWIHTKNKFYQFTTANGSNSNYIYKFYEDTKNHIWLISGNGIMKLIKSNIADVKPPKLNLLPIVKKGANEVRISFKSNELKHPEASSFQYKLNKTNWKNIADRTIELSNLKPGEYSFAIRAKNLNSNWSPVQYASFSILPKWHQTWWFRIMVLLSLLTGTVMLFLKRLSVVKKRNALLAKEIEQRLLLERKVNKLQEEVARDFHDEIGNKIASMIGLSTLLKGNNDKEKQRIHKITSLSKDIYETAKDFVWSLSPKNNNLNSLCTYLRDYGENFFLLFSDIDFFYYDDAMPPLDISYKKSRNLILAYKEILTNILKHAKASRVSLAVSIKENNLIVCIEDNGTGFNSSADTNGNGITNIKTRIQLMNATLQMKSENGVSYTITILIES